jgi:hypothetical protein
VNPWLYYWLIGCVVAALVFNWIHGNAWMAPPWAITVLAVAGGALWPVLALVVAVWWVREQAR